MKLTEASINGYGEHYNRRFGLDAAVIVVFGPNEAGKSTLFGFLRAMLYGFGRRSQAAERQEPVRGGRHGGRLAFRDESGNLYELERYADQASGKPKLKALGGEGDESMELETPMEQAALEGRFLGGMPERLFRQLYAITLTELQEVQSLSGGELSRFLYQAGWEEGNAVAAAEKKLNNEIEELFKPKGSNQKLSKGLKRLEQVDASLRHLKDDIDQFNKLKQSSELVERNLSALGGLLPEAESRLRLLRKAAHVRPVRLQELQLQAERLKLAYTERLPLGVDKAWEELQRARSAVSANIREWRYEEQLLKDRLSLLRYNDDWIAKGGETENLLLSAELMRSRREQLADAASELQQLDQAIAALITGISPEWTERQLRELIVTVADKDEARAIRDSLQSLFREEERIKAELQLMIHQEREAAFRLNEAEALLQRNQQRVEQQGREQYGLRPLARAELTALWNSLDDGLREWELVKASSQQQSKNASASGFRTSHSPNRLLYWRIGAAGSAGAAVALGAAAASGLLKEAAGVAVIGAVAAGGVSLALIAYLLWSLREGQEPDVAGGGTSGRGRSGRSSDRATDDSIALKERVVAALHSLFEEAVRLEPVLLDYEHHSYSGSAALQERSLVKQAIQERLAQLNERERLLDQREELALRHNNAAGLLHQARNSLEHASIRLQNEQASWEQWLLDRRLPAGMSPIAALESFKLAETALEKLRLYDRLLDKQHVMRQEIAAFGEKAALLCVDFEDGRLHVSDDPALALRLFQSEIKRQQDVKLEAEKLRSRLSELDALIGMEELRDKELRQASDEMIEAAALHDESQFEIAIEDHKRLRELDQELLQLDIELSAGLSTEQKRELDKLLADLDEEQLLAEGKVVQETVNRLEREKQELLEKRGSIRQAIAQLSNEDERQRLLLERELIVTEMHEAMDRYAVLKLSKSLIERTKRVYEEERQPAVLRKASLYMKQLTGGRYIRVAARQEQSELELINSNGSAVDSRFLSRGTAEQLYLAMRLALACEAAQGVKLPLLLDDLFVNFDQSRLHAAVRLVAELARDRQILLFTCHEHIRDALLRENEDAKLIAMEAVSGAGVTDAFANHENEPA
ncbi:AAA family ATPase [Paenibacillus sp. HB172176]|uniref:AAA family ATPase n=1 Tax=Paenibacillus sp. HB172176 TaxID=2493690 RepID=UPI00143C8F31|nr:AAA family ATPase [Paenibacillus sp. HB172176]